MCPVDPFTLGELRACPDCGTAHCGCTCHHDDAVYHAVACCFPRLHNDAGESIELSNMDGILMQRSA